MPCLSPLQPVTQCSATGFISNSSKAVNYSPVRLPSLLRQEVAGNFFIRQIDKQSPLKTTTTTNMLDSCMNSPCELKRDLHAHHLITPTAHTSKTTRHALFQQPSRPAPAKTGNPRKSHLRYRLSIAPSPHLWSKEIAHLIVGASYCMQEVVRFASVEKADGAWAFWGLTSCGTGAWTTTRSY